MSIYFYLGFFTTSFFLNCYLLFVSIRKLTLKNKVLSERNWFLSSQVSDYHSTIEIERHKNLQLAKQIEEMAKILVDQKTEIDRLKKLKNFK